MRNLVILVLSGLFCGHCASASLRESEYGGIRKITPDMKIVKVEHNGRGEPAITFDEKDGWKRWTGNKFRPEQGATVLQRIEIPFENPYMFPTGKGEFETFDFRGYPDRGILAVDLKSCLREPVWPRSLSNTERYLGQFMKAKSVYFSADCKTIFFAEDREYYLSRAIVKCADCKGYVTFDTPHLSPKLRSRVFARARSFGNADGADYNLEFPRRWPAKLPKVSVGEARSIEGAVLTVYLAGSTIDEKKQTATFELYQRFYYSLPTYAGRYPLDEYFFDVYTPEKAPRNGPVYLLAVIADAIVMPFTIFRAIGKN